MRQTIIWRTLRRFETLKTARRKVLFLSKKARRRLTGGSGLSTGDEIYLTFDDGPDPTYTPQILDLLAQYGAKAMFFVIGAQLEAGSEVMRRITREGHRVGNHTWNHLPLAGVPRDAFDEEIAQTQDQVERTTGLRPSTLRPPYGAMDSNTRKWASAAGVEIVMWDLDTHDWNNPGSSAIASSIIDYARSGDIVLMHDGGGGREQTVTALEEVLRQLSSRGVTFPLPPIG